MVTQFPKSKITDEVWDYVDSRPIKNLIYWVIDGNYRRSTNLVDWINTQLEITQWPDIAIGTSHDETMINILRWTHSHIMYKSDYTVWEMKDKWQTYDETYTKLTGDCEDGAIFMYIIARKLGIPKNRLMIMAGEVKDPRTKQLSGHAWLAYRSEGNPLTWEFLDWCYYYDNKAIGERQQFQIEGKTIFGNKNYLRLWFAFNEEKSHSELLWVSKD